MALSNTAIRYGGVTKFFHWLTALLILTLIALGLYASDLPHDTQDALTRKAWFFSLHKTLGVTVFFVALARIVWAFTQTKPGLLNADHKLQSWLAETVHWVLYGSLVIVPLAGWIGHAAASGFAPIWWPLGQSLPFIPKNTTLEHAFGTVHIIAGKLLIGALVLHVAGAVKHHVIDRDSTLRRMLPGEPAIGPLPAQHHSAAPVVTATVVWGWVWANRPIQKRPQRSTPWRPNGRSKMAPSRLRSRSSGPSWQAALPIGHPRSPLTRPSKLAKPAR